MRGDFQRLASPAGPPWREMIGFDSSSHWKLMNCRLNIADAAYCFSIVECRDPGCVSSHDSSGAAIMLPSGYFTRMAL